MRTISQSRWWSCWRKATLVFSLGEEEEKEKGSLELTMMEGNGEVVVEATMMSMLSVLDMVVGVLVASFGSEVCSFFVNNNSCDDDRKLSVS